MAGDEEIVDADLVVEFDIVVVALAVFNVDIVVKVEDFEFEVWVAFDADIETGPDFVIDDVAGVDFDVEADDSFELVGLAAAGSEYTSTA